MIFDITVNYPKRETCELGELMVGEIFKMPNEADNDIFVFVGYGNPYIKECMSMGKDPEGSWYVCYNAPDTLVIRAKKVKMHVEF